MNPEVNHMLPLVSGFMKLKLDSLLQQVHNHLSISSNLLNTYKAPE